MLRLIISLKSSLKPTFSLAVYFAFLISVAILAGCQSGELSRSEAAQMIAASPGYKAPVTVKITQTADGDPWAEGVTGNDDTPAKAVERAIIRYADASPQFAVGTRLGMISPNFVTKETTLPKNGFFDDRWEWHMLAKPTLNEKGKKLWTDYNLPPNENVIPLAMRDAPEVTGLTKISEGEIRAEYKFKYMPNEFGRYLDPSFEEFKSLPADMQDSIAGKLDKDGRPRDRIEADWRADQTGTAVFKKYDDGWRLLGAR